MLQLLRRVSASPVAYRALGQKIPPFSRLKRCHAITLRFSSSEPDPGKPLGLKDGVQIASGLSPSMQMLVMYVAVAMSAVVTIGRFKSRDAEADESVRIFNMAKRAVFKDHRVFENVGYPKEFERMTEYDADGSPTELKSSEGSFQVTGDKGSVVVHYRQKHRMDDEDSEIVLFDRLSVDCEDGTQFSALESFLQNQNVVMHQKSESLGHKMFIPVIGGVVIGGVASFVVIRILRNRPFYVHKLVVDHINNHDVARQLLGHPIKCDRSKYVGVLTSEAANYTIACNGPEGHGTIIVKAYKNDCFDEKSNGKKDRLTEVMMTPGTSWKFSTLVLSVSRGGKKTAQNAKTINLLTCRS